ncbi:MAG: winged helix-turn-helix transcriptional regulator [Oligoflexia bacterium]|nr:winged helix-turn-helix transcriptional regulator [Oligoflexia bacterium]
MIVIDVEEGDDKPFSTSGNYYKRFDAVTQKLSRKEIKEIFESSTSVHFDERVNSSFTISDISLKKIKQFYSAAKINYKVTSEKIPNILKSLNLMKGNSITNAGVLFFADKIDSFFVHSQTMMLGFKDYEGAVIFDRKEVRGDLLTQFNEAEFFLKRHLSLQAIIEDTRRRNVYEVPQAAWREAIANAIVHRDYKMSGTSIQIRVFPDRIEIINPGGLPDGVTTKNIGNLSSRRNEFIADMFARLDVVEKAGTGIVRIKKAMKEEKLPPPVFEDMGKFFKIILYRPKGVTIEIKGTTQKLPKKNYPRKTTQETMGDMTQTILSKIKSHPAITQKEIASELGLTYEGVKYHIGKLKTAGKIKHVGATKNGKWEILEE